MRTLVKRAMAGDGDAFVALIQECTQDMYKVAKSILRNEEDIADAIQETIVTVYEKLSGLNNPKYFKTWMIRILINHCNDIVRQEKRVLPGETKRMEEQIAERETGEPFAQWEFGQILSELEEKYRLVMVLYYVEQFRVREIAELLHVKESTVKTRLKRGREQMRRLYTGGECGSDFLHCEGKREYV